MWPRVSEIVLGIWLVLSPFVFGTPSREWACWVADLSAGILTILLALASLLTPLRKAHLAIFVIAIALIGFGYISSPITPALQNDLLTGLLLMMFAVVPGEASLPPRTWREYNANLVQSRGRSAKPR
jgi:hypothetical protein